jgi:hypothetical protein
MELSTGGLAEFNVLAFWEKMGISNTRTSKKNGDIETVTSKNCIKVKCNEAFFVVLNKPLLRHFKI